MFPSLIPFITVPPPAPPPGVDKIMVIVSWVFWGGGIAGVIGLIILGITMAVSHNRGHGSTEFGSKLGYIFGGLVLIGAAGGIVTSLLGI